MYAVPLIDESNIADNIVAVRDSIGKKYIPGSDPETMHMITEEAYTPFTFDAELMVKKHMKLVENGKLKTILWQVLF